MASQYFIKKNKAERGVCFLEMIYSRRLGVHYGGG